MQVTKSKLQGNVTQELGVHKEGYFHNYKKIMVIDDCQDTCQILKKYLGQINRLHVDTFLNEDSAIQQFFKTNYDLMIIDLYLVNANGLRLFKAFKKLTTYNLPVIFISQDIQGESLVKKDNFPCSHFVLKPIEKKELQSIIIKTLFT